MLILTTGNGVNCFTIDREMGFMGTLTERNIQIPVDTQEFAINMSNASLVSASNTLRE